MSQRTAGLLLGPFLFALVFFLPAPGSFSGSAESLFPSPVSPETVAELVFSMKVVLGLLLLMVVWWLTEAVPLPATALLPAVILPWFHLAGVDQGELTGLTFRVILGNFANPVIFLFLGGFLLAAAMRKWGLDRRLTYWILTRGNLAVDSRRVLFAVMSLTAFLSLWISNTATTAMMLPIGLGIVARMVPEDRGSRFGTAMMLGIAWSASVGGMGTMIGSPPNGIAIGILNATLRSTPGYEGITFLDWMTFGIPYVILFIPVVWLLLVKSYPPEKESIEGGKAGLLEEMRRLGSLSSGERWTIVVFFLAVFLWISNPFWPSLLPGSLADRFAWVDEFTIGLLAGAILFFLPVRFREPGFVLDWGDTKYVDWGTLILFGGGIALSDAMFKTGLASWIASGAVSLVGVPSTLILVIVIVLLVAILTEITSNTAVTTMIVPIVISVGRVTGTDPVTLAVAAALAASMAFMLPVATPPNALVFGTGEVKLRDMVRSGAILDATGWIFTVFVLWFFGSVLFHVVTF